MKESRWVWALAAVALIIVLTSTARDGGWLYLGAAALIGLVGYGVAQLAKRYGYELKVRRGVGLVMLAVMLVVLIAASTFIRSFELTGLLALASGIAVMFGLSLRKPPAVR